MFRNWKLRIVLLIVLSCLLVDILAHHNRRSQITPLRTRSDLRNADTSQSHSNISENPSAVNGNNQRNNGVDSNFDNPDFNNPVLDDRGAWAGRGRGNLHGNFNNGQNNQGTWAGNNANDFLRSNVATRQPINRFGSTGNSGMPGNTAWRHSNSMLPHHHHHHHHQQQQQQQQQQRQTENWTKRNFPFSQNRPTFVNNGRSSFNGQLFPNDRISFVSVTSTNRPFSMRNGNRRFQNPSWNSGDNRDMFLDFPGINVNDRGVPRIIAKNGIRINQNRNIHRGKNSQRQNPSRLRGDQDNSRNGAGNISRKNSQPEFDNFNQRIPSHQNIGPMEVNNGINDQNNAGTVKNLNDKTKNDLAGHVTERPSEAKARSQLRDPELDLAMETIEGYLAIQNKSTRVPNLSEKQDTSLVYPSVPSVLSLSPLVVTTDVPVPQTSTPDGISSLVTQLIQKPRMQVTQTDLKLIEEIKMLMKHNSNSGLVSDGDMKLLNEIELIAKGNSVVGEGNSVVGEGSSVVSEGSSVVSEGSSVVSDIMGNENPNLVVNSIESGIASGQSVQGFFANFNDKMQQNDVNQQTNVLPEASTGVDNNHVTPVSDNNQQLLQVLENILNNPSNPPLQANVNTDIQSGNTNLITELDKLLRVQSSDPNSQNLGTFGIPQVRQLLSNSVGPQKVDINTNNIVNRGNSEVNILKELNKLLQEGRQPKSLTPLQSQNVLNTNMLVGQQSLLNQNQQGLQPVGTGVMSPGVLPLGQTHSTIHSQSSPVLKQIANMRLGAGIQQQRLLMNRQVMLNPMAQLIRFKSMVGPNAMMELMYGDTTDPPDPVQKPEVLTTSKPITPPDPVQKPEVITIKPITQRSTAMHVFTTTKSTTTQNTTTTTTIAPLTTTSKTTSRPKATQMFKMPFKTLMERISKMIDEKTKKLKETQAALKVDKVNKTISLPQKPSQPPQTFVKTTEKADHVKVVNKQINQTLVLSKIQESVTRALKKAGIKNSIQFVVRAKEKSTQAMKPPQRDRQEQNIKLKIRNHVSDKHSNQLSIQKKPKFTTN